MRTFKLAKSGLNKIRAQHKELKHNDVEESLKSLPPGEWCFFQGAAAHECWVGFVNPLIEDKYSCIQIISPWQNTKTFDPELFIVEQLGHARQKRLRFKGYQNWSRLFYGISDGLPGLIIDVFKDKAIIQINTAGIDRYRELIRKTIADLIQGEAYFLDNPKYREKEYLPTYKIEPLPSLIIEENDLKYEVRAEVLQKVGFYYDHRENRKQLSELLQRLSKLPERGLDLFCYAGAWGLNALKAGIQHVTFVDQGDFGPEIEHGLRLNEYGERGEFKRQDVFKFLDEAIAQKKQFDLILCDPPAFAKSHLQKDQALEGYSKLHRKVFKVAAPKSILAFSSCTHYVSHSEFQKNVVDAASRENKKLQLLYTGIQGWDHPIASLDDRSNYIKSYFYSME